MTNNSNDHGQAASTSDISTPAADAGGAADAASPPTSSATVSTESEATRARAPEFDFGSLLLATGLAAAVLHWRDDDEQAPLWAPRPIPRAEPPTPPAPPKPIPAPLGPVTDQPKTITYLWCWQCAWRTPSDVLKRVVPSASRRRQYIRIATRITTLWGKELDARTVPFEAMLWIVATPDFLETQARYLAVLAGERPPRRTTRFRRTKRRPSTKGWPMKEMACVSGVAEIADDGPAPRTEACSRCESMRQWHPAAPLPCWEDAQEEAARMQRIYALVEDLCKKRRVSFGPEQRVQASSSCRPPAECAGRRSRAFVAVIEHWFDDLATRTEPQ